MPSGAHISTTATVSPSLLPVLSPVALRVASAPTNQRASPSPALRVIASGAVIVVVLMCCSFRFCVRETLCFTVCTAAP